jgi:hypothetical protein
MFKIWAEWDIGTDDFVFSSLDKAREFARIALMDNDIIGDTEEFGFDFQTLEDVEDAGLISFDPVKLDPEIVN